MKKKERNITHLNSKDSNILFGRIQVHRSVTICIDFSAVRLSKTFENFSDIRSDTIYDQFHESKKVSQSVCFFCRMKHENLCIYMGSYTRKFVCLSSDGMQGELASIAAISEMLYLRRTSS